MLSAKDIAYDHVANMVQQASSQIARKMAADIDAALEAAIKSYLGVDKLDVDALPGVLRCRMFAAHMPDGSTEYRIDEQPILWVGPARTELTAGAIHMNFDMRRLLPEATRNES